MGRRGSKSAIRHCQRAFERLGLTITSSHSQYHSRARKKLRFTRHATCASLPHGRSGVVTYVCAVYTSSCCRAHTHTTSGCQDRPEATAHTPRHFLFLSLSQTHTFRISFFSVNLLSLTRSLAKTHTHAHTHTHNRPLFLVSQTHTNTHLSPLIFLYSHSFWLGSWPQRAALRHTCAPALASVDWHCGDGVLVDKPGCVPRVSRICRQRHGPTCADARRPGCRSITTGHWAAPGFHGGRCCLALATRRVQGQECAKEKVLHNRELVQDLFLVHFQQAAVDLGMAQVAGLDNDKTSEHVVGLLQTRGYSHMLGILESRRG